MTTFKVGDGSEDAVLFVTLPLVVPEWFRVAFMGALREMTIEGNWFVEGDSTANFARDKAVEMINGIEFSEVNPLPMYTPPIGSIQMWPSVTPPDGWLKCWGDSLLRADYADLFSVIGVTFGASDGTHFNLPDYRDKMPLGGKSNFAGGDYIGTTGGAATVTLTEAEMPTHNHVQVGYASGGTTPVQNIVGARTGSSTAVNVTQSRGGGEPHENMPPYLTINFIIYAGL